MRGFPYVEGDGLHLRYGGVRHRERGPLVAGDLSTCGEGLKKIVALRVARGVECNGAERTGAGVLDGELSSKTWTYDPNSRRTWL
jgi:hypothetical protein